MDIATLDKVRALGPEAAAVVQWALTLEGALHKIEEEVRYAHDGGHIYSVREICAQALSK